LVTFFVGIFQILGGAACTVDRSGEENYTAAPPSYGILAEKSLDLMAGLDVEAWGIMLSSSVVYYFPDGEKKLIGKKAVLDWWKNYISTTGIKAMSIENASYMPIEVKNAVRPGELSGTQVIAYFSNKMICDRSEVSVKMNFIIHFDKDKLIDAYYTYYDPAPMIKMQKDKIAAGNFLTTNDLLCSRRACDIVRLFE